MSSTQVSSTNWHIWGDLKQQYRAGQMWHKIHSNYLRFWTDRWASRGKPKSIINSIWQQFVARWIEPFRSSGYHTSLHTEFKIKTPKYLYLLFEFEFYLGRNVTTAEKVVWVYYLKKTLFPAWVCSCEKSHVIVTLFRLSHKNTKLVWTGAP